ncbi:MAG: hypothetical protein WKF29_05210 [Thermoleophilaceae bacterium]
MSAQNAAAYAAPEHDAVRRALEPAFFARLLPRLLARAGGGRILDLGCGDCLAARLAGPALTGYTGVDHRALEDPVPGNLVHHDLAEGLGPVGREPFDLYLGTFGVASHLGPAELRSLLYDIADHARPGSLVALEALGLHSLEWPGLWDTAPGCARTLNYRLRHDVEVHPWSARELSGLHEAAGIQPLFALDRSAQTGPKTGDAGLWPGVPALRTAMNALLEDAGAPPGQARATLAQPLPPLPAGAAAAVHHSLALRRRDLLEHPDHETMDGVDLAHAIWALEPRSGGGFGHGLTVVGRVS